jgi:hypothetical protein
LLFSLRAAHPILDVVGYHRDASCSTQIPCLSSFTRHIHLLLPPQALAWRRPPAGSRTLVEVVKVHLGP